MQTDIVPVEIQTKAAEIEAATKEYENYAIATPEKYQIAALDLKAVKSKAKELTVMRQSLTKPLDESKSRLMDFFRRPLEILEKTEAVIKHAMANWQIDQENKRKIEQARLNEIARKEEAKKRAEKDRQETEWRAKEEAARKEAERLAAQGQAEEAAKAQAGADRAAAKAQERAEQAATVSIPAPIVAPKVGKVAGIVMREIWKFRIVNVNLIPREFMLPDEKKLGELARLNKNEAKVSGVEFYSENVIAAGTM